ncbi:hypothetical protein FBY28_4899 [Arthrobacter sp. SLBN-53]|nr:hypothetical protein FBY28_4899 [Arthrobacter sp. SLBN-53]
MPVVIASRCVARSCHGRRYRGRRHHPGAAQVGPPAGQGRHLIGDNEGVRAPDLAARVGTDTARVKRRVRQLKGLGLTISLGTGYRLSPRGQTYLRLN